MAGRVQARALSCPNCGSIIQLRGFAHTLTAVCGSCAAVLDTSNPTLARIVQAQNKFPRELDIPLGERCVIDGVDWQVIGFQQRAIFVEGQSYAWQEYVLMNPFKGFRFLTDYNGHWNFVRILQALPDDRAFRTATYQGAKYKAFQVAQATTQVVLGEFPWRAVAGEQAAVHDFMNPPMALSKEVTPAETVWSLGRYLQHDELTKAFGGRIKFPEAAGVYSNQPNPHAGKPLKMWVAWLILMGALFGLAIFMKILHSERQVFNYGSVFHPSETAETSFVTDYFDIKGSFPSAVDIKVNASPSQTWASFAIALINADTGEGYDFGKMVSYYSGTDSDGAWTEGSTQATQSIPRVKPGRYYLRVEPDREKEAGETDEQFAKPIPYQITVHQDVNVFWPYPLAFLLLLIPPILSSARYASFEGKRWAESDFGEGNSGSSDDDSSGDDD